MAKRSRPKVTKVDTKILLNYEDPEFITEAEEQNDHASGARLHLTSPYLRDILEDEPVSTNSNEPVKHCQKTWTGVPRIVLYLAN